MAFYQQEHLVWTYHHAHRNELDPSVSDIDGWDDTLHNRYDDLLDEIMPEFGIRRTVGNKSRIVLLAHVSTGGARRKVREACEYFQWISGLGSRI